jgi:hypothetical protein
VKEWKKAERDRKKAEENKEEALEEIKEESVENLGSETESEDIGPHDSGSDLERNTK